MQISKYSGDEGSVIPSKKCKSEQNVNWAGVWGSYLKEI